MTEPLQMRLEAIGRIDRAARRGRELEYFVADVFTEHHFKVTLNAGAARPRQTDLFASKVDEAYLVECKWLKSRATINEIASLRDRLRRTDRAVVGILLSMSGFSSSVVSDVLQHRDQPVVLISGDELRAIAGGHVSLPGLLWRKRGALSTDGKVLLDEPTDRLSAEGPVRLLPAQHDIVRADGTRVTVLDCAGSFDRFLFSHVLPDIDWLPASGHGVSLDVTPPMNDEREVLELLNQLASLGWTTEDARWSIQQSTMNWHGLGADGFVDVLPRWRSRVGSPRSHHREEFCYLDRCDGGFYTLSADLAADTGRRTTAVDLSFQLQGVPLDVGPLQQLCRSIGVHDGVYFRPRADASVKRHRTERTAAENVQPLGYVTTLDTVFDTAGTEWVTGVIVPNPYRASDTDVDAKAPSDGLEVLRDSELLICSLAHHHPISAKRYTYYIRWIEYAWTSNVMVCRPIADWDEPKSPA